jgi:hypothetical protein
MDQTLRFWLESGVVAARGNELALIDKSKVESGGKNSGFASIVVSRFDRLNANVQIVLKMAAVLGRCVLSMDRNSISVAISKKLTVGLPSTDESLLLLMLYVQVVPCGDSS